MKNATLIITLLVACFSLHAQLLKVGVKAGATANKIDGQSFKDKFTYGYNLGAVTEIKLKKNSEFTFQPELMYQQIRFDTATEWKTLYQNLSNINTMKNLKLGYINIPILVNYKLANILKLQAGPQFGILVDRNLNLLQNGKNAFKNGDFSVLGGAQINLGKLFIQGRYSVGLNNLNDIDNKDRWRNQQIQLSGGFFF